ILTQHFFFFQAEDGIRDRNVTGVQTCALPILLEQRVGLLLQNYDAYLKTAGGVKLNEPAIDLAIAVSIASSYRETETNVTDCFVGEIGLTGEIRRVSNIETRINEAAKLGFKRIFIPKNNLEGWTVPKGIEVIGCLTLQDVINQAL